MADKKAAAAAAKARGNTAFTSGDFQKGIDEFTVAIDNDPTDHVFFSNRSACYASLNKYAEALKDANECVRLKPDWPKGYSRQGVAFFNLKQLDEAKGAYEKGVSLEPANQATKDALAQVNGAIEAAKRPPPNPMGKLFGADMWGKLQANPTTREYLKDEAFVAKMKMMQSNPSLLSSLGSDPKLSTAIGVILGIDLSARGGPAGADEDAEMDARNAPAPASAGAAAAAAPASSPSASSKPATPSGNVHIGDDEDDDEEMPAAKKADEKKPAAAAAPALKAEAPKPEVKETKDQKSANLNKEAEDEKVKGNDFYKKKQFDEAIKHYEKAQEIDPKNATYILNTTAALLESKQYEKCNDLCRRGIELAQTNMAGFEIVAKFYLRLGTSYMATKNYGDAVSSFNKSLLEQSSDKARQLLKKATELKKQADELAYQDKGKSLEAKERGNKLFTDGKFIDAIPEYTEAIRRDPGNPALYSNRAGCYTKVMDWARALEDCEKALSLDPNFVKVYIRKAKIQHLLKQYKKAMETYDAGLKLDPKASELIEGRMATMRAIRQSSQSGQADPERLKEAMRDPEIRGILNDMTMQKVLKDLQENPAAANAAMADKDIRANIEKLIAAGVLSVG